MINYSWFEQKLHQLALSSQFMREVTFDFESTNFTHPSLNDDHVFIAGMARAGTTILLNALHESNIFGSLSYSDMPFVLAPNLWAKISFSKGMHCLVTKLHYIHYQLHHNFCVNYYLN